MSKKTTPPAGRKVRETRFWEGGAGGPHWQDRVRVLPEGEELPEGADWAADDAPEHDWQPAE